MNASDSAEELIKIYLQERAQKILLLFLLQCQKIIGKQKVKQDLTI